jgi:4-alpha-glucanotransferase
MIRRSSRRGADGDADAPARSLVEPGYVDASGVFRRTPRETAVAIERALGDSADGETNGVPRTRFVRAGKIAPLSEPAELRLEDGTTLRVDKRLPRDLPLGYHELRSLRSERCERLIVTPERCIDPPRRTWGLGVQLYALRSRKSWGMGDLGELRRFGAFARKTLDADLLLLNPLGAASPTLPQESSPYSPTSRLYKNALYIDIAAIPGARRVRGMDALAREGRALLDKPMLERDRVFVLKMRALERLFASFTRTASPRAFERYLAREGKLLTGFATFAALSERNGADSSRWPPEYRDPANPAVARYRARHAGRVRFHAWLQWLLDEQLAKAAKSVDLVFDLPVGVSPGGADAWLFQTGFTRELHVGAPPDAFNTGGQDWGLSAFSPSGLTRTQFEPFIRTVRASFRHGRGLRIDHVMSLFRLYVIPKDGGARNGGYVRYPHRELLDILALESHRAGAFVVGEDLGTVDASHRRELARRRVLSCRLVWFESKKPRSYPRRAFAAVTTHDLPTIAGLVTGKDAERRARHGVPVDSEADRGLVRRFFDVIGSGDETDLHAIVARAYTALSRAPSAVVIATLEDAIAAVDRPNLPGVAGAPSFCLPLSLDVDAIQRHPLLRRLAKILSARR